MSNTNGSNRNESNLSTYEDHIERSESQYVVAFQTFWGRLTPKQRQQLELHGIEGPVIDYSSIASMDNDAADTPAASYSEDLAEKLDRLSDQLCEKFGLRPAIAVPLASFIIHTIEQESISYKAWLFGKVCGLMLNAKNAKLCAAGLAFASNLASLNGLRSMRVYARQIGVSVAAVSKVKRKWQEELELPDSPHSKDPEACANYAAAQTGDKHWRNKKVTVAALRDHRAETLEKFPIHNESGSPT